ncbi:hypothetical protein ACJX0J_032991, partial [Zea mays]
MSLWSTTYSELTLAEFDIQLAEAFIKPNDMTRYSIDPSFRRTDGETRYFTCHSIFDLAFFEDHLDDGNAIVAIIEILFFFLLVVNHVIDTCVMSLAMESDAAYGMFILKGFLWLEYATTRYYHHGPQSWQMLKLCIFFYQ